MHKGNCCTYQIVKRSCIFSHKWCHFVPISHFTEVLFIQLWRWFLPPNHQWRRKASVTRLPLLVVFRLFLHIRQKGKCQFSVVIAFLSALQDFIQYLPFRICPQVVLASSAPCFRRFCWRFFPQQSRWFGVVSQRCVGAIGSFWFRSQ